MDSAKMIRLLATNDAAMALTEPMENNDFPALFIPTTSGSGSEATKTSVFYINENEKFSVHNYDFIPDYVLFDERLLETVPDYQRKSTCLDALCHSIESYWSTVATDESREYAAKSIRLFFKHKEAYIHNQKEGNSGMLEASYYGGKAINITGTTAPHAMCYNITMNCGTAHGHSVAVVLAALWEWMLKKEYPKEVFISLAKLMGGACAEDGARIFRSLIEEFQLACPKISEDALDVFTAKVNVSKLKTNPVLLSNEDIKELYRRALCD